MSNPLPSPAPETAARRLVAKRLQAGYEFIAFHAYCDSDNQPLYWRIRLQHKMASSHALR